MGSNVGDYDGTRRTPLIARYPTLPIHSYPGQSCYIRLLVFNIINIKIQSASTIAPPSKFNEHRLKNEEFNQ